MKVKQKYLDLTLTAQNGENLTEDELSYIKDSALNLINNDPHVFITLLRICEARKKPVALPTRQEKQRTAYQDLTFDKLLDNVMSLALADAQYQFKWKCPPDTFITLVRDLTVIEKEHDVEQTGTFMATPPDTNRAEFVFFKYLLTETNVLMQAFSSETKLPLLEPVSITFEAYNNRPHDTNDLSVEFQWACKYAGWEYVDLSHIGITGLETGY